MLNPIFLFFNTSLPIERYLARLSNFKIKNVPFKYLGVPLVSKPLRISYWNDLHNKFLRKVSNWTFRALNLPMRATLVKAIHQTMPIYQIFVTSTPKAIYVKIVAIFRKCLWQGVRKKKKLVFVSWEKLF